MVKPDQHINVPEKQTTLKPQESAEQARQLAFEESEDVWLRVKRAVAVWILGQEGRCEPKIPPITVIREARTVEADNPLSATPVEGL